MADLWLKFLLLVSIFSLSLPFNHCNIFMTHITALTVNGDEPVVIPDYAEVNDGTFILVTDNGLTSRYFYHHPRNFSELFIGISFYQNVTLSLSFSTSFPGNEQVSVNGLVLASIPVTINASGFKNWTVDTFYYPPAIQKNSVSFYRVTSFTFTRLPTETGPIAGEEFVALNEFAGNGTYVLLGKARDASQGTPLWLYLIVAIFSPPLLLFMGVAVVIIGLIIQKTLEKDRK